MSISYPWQARPYLRLSYMHITSLSCDNKHFIHACGIIGINVKRACIWNKNTFMACTHGRNLGNHVFFWKRTRGFAVCEKTGKPQPVIFNSNDLFETHCVTTFNGVIASYPGDVAAHDAFKHAWTNVKPYDHIKKLTLEMAGPRLFDRYVFATKKPILRLQSFFPCNIDADKACYQKDDSNNAMIYGMHTWEGSWWE